MTSSQLLHSFGRWALGGKLVMDQTLFKVPAVMQEGLNSKECEREYHYYHKDDLADRKIKDHRNTKEKVSIKRKRPEIERKPVNKHADVDIPRVYPD